MKSKVWKNRILDLVCDIVGGLLYATAIYSFAKMAGFAPGGISGLAIIINHLCGVPIGVMTLLLNIPLILVSYRVLGNRFLLKSARTMIICTIFVDTVFPYTPPYTGSPLLAALYYGVCLGAGLAIFYMRGTSSGGVDFLTLSIRAKKPHLSMGKLMMAIDFLIVSLGWPVFGNIDSILYGLLATFVTSAVVDKIMYGMGAGTLAVVVTNRSAEVAERISRIIDRGSTVLEGVGSYTGEHRDILLCACSNSQSYIVKNSVLEVDPAAFVMMTETSQVFGEGFLR